MCGRFAQYSPIETLQQSFTIKTITCEAFPNFNVAPASEILAVIRRRENRLGKLRWGLVPSWSRNASQSVRRINARAETLLEKNSFRDAFLYRRCLLPADGFYEWQKKGHHKQAWYFSAISGKPFAFAGLWETWTGQDGSALHTCAIITTAANEALQGIHDRMPLILHPNVYEQWLDPAINRPEPLNTMLTENCLKELRGYPVSARVNSITNNDSSLVEPIN